MKTAAGHIITSLSLLAAVVVICCAANPSYQTTSDGKQYLVDLDLQVNWLQAHEECARRGLQLLEIDNKEKNQFVIEMLQKISANSRSVWLGYHDGFNKAQDTQRPFYSMSTGEKLSFSYWKSGEPNNIGSHEHCVHVWDTQDFHWNDQSCELTYGLVCEEHHLTTKYYKEMDQKRQTVHKENNKLSTEFTVTQNQLKDIGENTRHQTDYMIMAYQKALSVLLSEMKESIVNIVKKKPYLVVLLGSSLNNFNEVAAEYEAMFSEVSKETRQNIQDLQLSAENEAIDATSEFNDKLTSNTDEINNELVF